MTPKEKAEELVNKFTFQRDEHEMFVAKQCALIAVDEMIEEAYFTDGYYDRQDFWQKVKEEIEKL